MTNQNQHIEDFERRIHEAIDHLIDTNPKFAAAFDSLCESYSSPDGGAPVPQD